MSEQEYFNVADIFGENVFNDAVMQERLPKKVYKKLHEVMDEGKELDLETADVIAHEMKEWAIEKGATHYTHWFQPLTGVTAEKHDSSSTASPRWRASWASACATTCPCPRSPKASPPTAPGRWRAISRNGRSATA